MKGRAAYGIAFAALFVFAAACGSGSSPTPGGTPEPRLTPTPGATSTPSLTQSETPPFRDLADLARRFRGLPDDAPKTARDAPYDYEVGDSEELTILNLDGPSLETVTVSVRLVTDHAYFFLQKGVAVSDSTLSRIGDDFESTVYPTVSATFGSEWSPGVDADERISIVHADLHGAGGYFTSADEYPTAAVARSNEREAVYMESAVLDDPGDAYNALLAHELQHMVNWNVDPGEESWVNEGLSQLAAELAGGGGMDLIASFLDAPDSQLTYWPMGGGLHYGESHLLLRYILDRYGGRKAASELIAAHGHGFAGLQAYLDGFGAKFDTLFADWLLANYLDEPSGPYAHNGGDFRVSAVEELSGFGEGEGSVSQFAADYFEIEPGAGRTVLAFDGSDSVGIGIEPQDGAFWWSNEGDSIDSRLTREFDLSDLDSATLRFRARFNTERGWDYAYVAASDDGGETWTALPGRHTTDFDPVQNAYGPGYTGDSGGDWLDEEIDLSDYAGGEVLVRFEYVTDDATYGRGFAVDDVEIPELGFTDDGSDASGWQDEGFKRIDGPLPQHFLVQLVEREGERVVVRRPVLPPDNTLELELDGAVTLVVAAMTDMTTDAATYTWTLRAP